MKKYFMIALLCIWVSGVKAQSYCTPTFGRACDSFSMSSSLRQLIGTSGAIIDTTRCTGAGYFDYTSSMVCTLTAGNTYLATLSITDTYYTSTSAELWIDYNNDGAFDTTEMLGGVFYPTTPHPVIAFSVPTTASLGTRRLRMTSNYCCCGYSAYPYMNPCPTASTWFGDSRDYSVIIDSAIAPYGTLTPSALSFGPTTAGTTSSPMTTVFNGYYLTPASGTVTVTAPTNYLVSSTAGGTYTSSCTITYSSGTVTSSPIFVKFVAPATAGSYSGSVCVSGGGLPSAVCASVSGSSASTLNIKGALQHSCDMYPNPANDQVTIQVDNMTTGEVLVTNSVGTVVMRAAIASPITKLSIKDLAPGIYTVKIAGEGGSVVKRLVKM